MLERKQIRVLLEGVFKRFKTPRAPHLTKSNMVREYLRDSRPPAETEALHFWVIMLRYDCWHCDFVCEHGNALLPRHQASWFFLSLHGVDMQVALSFAFYFCSCSSVCVCVLRCVSEFAHSRHGETGCGNGRENLLKIVIIGGLEK